MASFEDGESRVDCVQISGLVVLKIIKHCKENTPEFVTGQLLGLDSGSTLEVTNCFPTPFPNRSEWDDGEAGGDAGLEYQIEMMKNLRDVNVDSNTVGWYQSTFLGAFVNIGTIESQFNYQANLKKCVVVVYDPAKTVQGSLSLQAYRLTDQFISLFPDQQFSPDVSLGSITYLDIFEEIPIRIHNSSLINALLYELDSRDVIPKPEHARLELTNSRLLQKNLEYLIEESDDLISEQHKLQYHQRSVQRQQQQQAKWIQQRKQENLARRRKGEEELPEKGDENDPLWKPIVSPAQLDSLLITNQIQFYCDQTNQLLGASLDKHILLSGLHKK